MRSSVSRFWQQLKQRRVIKTLLAYMIGAWVLIEGAAIVFPALNFPEGSLRFIILIAVAGVIPVLILAWVFDIVRTDSDDNDEATGSLPDESSLPVSLNAPPSLDSAVASVAVLPFTNLATDTEHAHFADGIAFELHSLLSKLHRVRVASRKSSFTYRDDGKDIKEIAKSLNVHYILTGSVRYMNKQLRVIAELDNAIKGVQIWSRTYDRSVDNIFEVESEIAQAIVGAFGVERLRIEIAGTTRVPTKNLDAWGRVQKARSYLIKSDQSSFEQAFDLLESAIKLDPDYAAAHAMLGSIFAERYLNGFSENPAKDRAKSIVATERARELRREDAFVLKMAGLVLAYDGQISESLSVLHRAVRIAPYDFGAWGYFGWPLVATGGENDLVKLHNILDRLLEMAPGHPGEAYWLYHKSVTYGCQGNNSMALEYARKATDERPDFSLAWMQYANALGHTGEYSEAQDAASRSSELNTAMTPGHYSTIISAMSDDKRVRERRIGGLEKAGLISDQWMAVSS